MEKIRQLEEKIGYRFNDIAILRNAVTHSSYIKEHDRREKSNERLEFLGDAILDAISRKTRGFSDESTFNTPDMHRTTVLLSSLFSIVLIIP